MGDAKAAAAAQKQNQKERRRWYHLPPTFSYKENSIVSLLTETSRPRPDTFYPRIPTPSTR